MHFAWWGCSHIIRFWLKCVILSFTWQFNLLEEHCSHHGNLFERTYSREELNRQWGLNRSFTVYHRIYLRNIFTNDDCTHMKIGSGRQNALHCSGINVVGPPPLIKTVLLTLFARSFESSVQKELPYEWPISTFLCLWNLSKITSTSFANALNS